MLAVRQATGVTLRTPKKAHSVTVGKCGSDVRFVDLLYARGRARARVGPLRDHPAAQCGVRCAVSPVVIRSKPLSPGRLDACVGASRRPAVPHPWGLVSGPPGRWRRVGTSGGTGPPGRVPPPAWHRQRVDSRAARLDRPARHCRPEARRWTAAGTVTLERWVGQLRNGRWNGGVEQRPWILEHRSGTVVVPSPRGASEWGWNADVGTGRNEAGTRSLERPDGRPGRA